MAVSKDGLQYRFVIPGTSDRERHGRPASPTSSSSLREADCFGRADELVTNRRLTSRCRADALRI